jgi:nitroreductase
MYVGDLLKASFAEGKNCLAQVTKRTITGVSLRLRGLVGLDVLEAIRMRRSVRAFTGDAVSEEEVQRLIEAARWAPSAGNLQPWEFVIVRDRETKRKLSIAALDQTFIEDAPVVIVVCADQTRSARRYQNRGAHLYSLQDTAAATQNILLTVHAMELGACWIGAFDESGVREVLGTPRNWKPVAIVPVGHSAERPVAPPRRSIDEIIHRESL